MAQAPRTFVSFDFDNDEAHKNLFIGQAKNSKTPFDIHDWSSKSHLPQNQWESIIYEKINKCNLMVILVGRSTAYATGVIKEINFAITHNVPYFGVYVDGANVNSMLPRGLENHRVTSWDWDYIASAINQMMTEGKNR